MHTTLDLPNTRKITIRIKHSYIILGILLLIFLADGSNSIFKASGASFYRISIIIRSVTLIYLLSLLLINKTRSQLLLIIIFFYTVFVIGSGAAQHLFSEYNFWENFSIINKLLYFFVCYAAFSLVFQSDKDRKNLFTIFELIVFIEIISILIGFIFNIDVLSSYGNRRFGYKGLIPAQNEVSGFFIIAFFYYLAKVNYLARDTFRLIVAMIAGLLTGTKVALIMPFVFVIQLFFWLTKRRGKWHYFYLAVVFIFLVAIGIIFWDNILTTVSPTIEYYSHQITNANYSPFVVIGTSGRLVSIEEFLVNYLPRYNILNYLFGGMDLSIFSTETDLLDTFMRLGIVGLLVFYAIYIRILIGNIRKVNIIRLLFLFTWLGVSTTAGHLVFSAINGGYLAILMLSFTSFERHNNLSMEINKAY